MEVAGRFCKKTVSTSRVGEESGRLTERKIWGGSGVIRGFEDRRPKGMSRRQSKGKKARGREEVPAAHFLQNRLLSGAASEKKEGEKREGRWGELEKTRPGGVNINAAKPAVRRRNPGKKTRDGKTEKRRKKNSVLWV